MHVLQALNFVYMAAHTYESDPMVHVQLVNCTYLRVTIAWDARYYLFEKAVVWTGGMVSIDTVGQIKVIVMKNESIMWDEHEGVKTFHQGFLPLVLPDYYPTKVSEKIKINDDIYVLRLINQMDVFSHVDIGKYINVKKTLNGKELIKSYYNVPMFPIANLSYPNAPPGTWMPNTLPTNIVVNAGKGEMNQWLASREVGDEVLISNPQGKFTSEKLEDSACIVFITCEMGITAVLSIILWVLQTSSTSVHLISFNEYELDLVFFEELMEVRKMENRFKADFFIGNATYDWHLKIGRPSPQAYDRIFKREVFDNSTKFCIAGNPVFQNQVTRYFTTKLKVPRKRIVLFDDFYTKDDYKFWQLYEIEHSRGRKVNIMNE